MNPQPTADTPNACPNNCFTLAMSEFTLDWTSPSISLFTKNASDPPPLYETPQAPLVLVSGKRHKEDESADDN